MGAPIIRRDELEALLDAQAERILSEVAALVAVATDKELDDLIVAMAERFDDEPAEADVEPEQPDPAPEAEPEPEAKPRKGRKADAEPALLDGLDGSE